MASAKDSSNKIVYVTNLYPTESRPYFGTFVENSAEGLRACGWDVTVLALPHFGEGAIAYIKFYFAVFKFLMGYSGIVYVHYISHSSLPVSLAKIFNKKLKIVLHYHGSDAFPESHEGKFRGVIKDTVCKLANRSAVAMAAPSIYFANKLSSKFGLGVNQIIVSPSGGFNPEVFHPPAEKPSGRDGIIRVLFASRMLEEKGCLIAAKAALLIADKHLNVEFSFVGYGPLQGKVHQILEDLVSQGRCKLYGLLPQSELAAKFGEADLFLFPSYREGESLGLVVVEAMACGAFPLAFDRGALREFLGGVERESLCSGLSDFSGLVNKTLSRDLSELGGLQSRVSALAGKYECKRVAEDLSAIMLDL